MALPIVFVLWEVVYIRSPTATQELRRQSKLGVFSALNAGTQVQGESTQRSKFAAGALRSVASVTLTFRA